MTPFPTLFPHTHAWHFLKNVSPASPVTLGRGIEEGDTLAPAAVFGASGDRKSSAVERLSECLEGDLLSAFLPRPAQVTVVEIGSSGLQGGGLLAPVLVVDETSDVIGVGPVSLRCHPHLGWLVERLSALPALRAPGSRATRRWPTPGSRRLR